MPTSEHTAQRAASDSPLGIIERNVQDRAKTMTLDVAGPDGDQQLRTLINTEIDQWQDDHKRGIRTYPLLDPTAIAERAFRNIARYGPLTPLLG